ncbi:MAG TPA: DUF1080 domain-containing protein [Phytomonospora sp.]
MTSPFRPVLGAFAAAALLAGTASAQAPARVVKDGGGANTLTRAERAAGWTLLFDGASFRGWHGLGWPAIPAAHWRIVDGAIEKVATRSLPKGADGKAPPGGDLSSDATYGDFELSWEWKATPGANSGVKYNVSEELSTGQPETAMRPATGARGPSHSAIGFEYQMIDDDRHPDGKLIKHKTGDLSDLISSNEKKHVKPIGEWNQSRIVFKGNHGEHWLNGQKVVEYDLGTPAMTAAVAASKYKIYPWFADRRRGHVVLQDHGDEVYFRNIKLRELGR